MNAVAAASTLMRLLAEPYTAGEGVKSAVRRAARRAGLDTGLGKRLWYGEARRIDSEVMDQLRQSAGDTKALEQALAARRALYATLTRADAILALPPADVARDVGHEASRQDRPRHRTLATRAVGPTATVLYGARRSLRSTGERG